MSDASVASPSVSEQAAAPLDWRAELAAIDTTGSTLSLNDSGLLRITLDRRVTGKAFKQVVEYLYTDRVNWDKDTDTGLIQETKEAADYLSLPRLSAICDTYLDKNKNIQVPESTWWANMKWAFDHLRDGPYSLSDLVLVTVDEVEVPCHAVVVTSACKYFHGLLLGEVDNEAKATMRVVIRNANEAQLMAILKYIYTREFDLNVNDVIGVWILSNTFLLEDLQVECESMIQKNLNLENAAGIKRIAQKVGSRRILELCEDLLRNATGGGGGGSSTDDAGVEEES